NPVLIERRHAEILKDQSEDEDVINAQSDLDEVAREKFHPRLGPQPRRVVAANPSQIDTQTEKQSERDTKRCGLNGLGDFNLVSLALKEPKIHAQQHADEKHEKCPPIPIHARCVIEDYPSARGVPPCSSCCLAQFVPQFRPSTQGATSRRHGRK